VDDDPSVRRALSRLLRMAGLQVALFASAADLLADMPATLACLVLDIHLGGMSGLELLTRFRAEGNNVPALIITAHDDPHSREQATKAGCIAYLRKPFKPPEFLQAVFRAINWDAQCAQA
jgi:FixJ family two-component response regulator